MDKFIKITKGNNGWGGPLYLKVEGKKNKVVSMTGGGINPVATYIAELCGGEAIDGFKKSVPDEEILCVVIDCGGTLRCGVYPQKGIPTINVNPIGPSGPLKQYMKEEIYVSDVKKENISVVESNGKKVYGINKNLEETEKRKNENSNTMESSEMKSPRFTKLIESLARSIGKLISMLYESGKESVDVVLRSVIPFMAFVSVIVTIILSSGIGTIIANILSPLAGSLWGLLLISIICGIPFLSPILGPGAAIAQVVGVLIGTEIGLGHIPPQYALPALFAINVQVGADFVPVGLSMQEAKPKTIEYGTAAFLISRQLTGPLAVLLAYLLSFGLFK